VPSSPQVFASLAGQVWASRGFVPAGAKVHVPIAVGAVHVLQVSVQALLQQTPSTQKVLAQSAAQEQASPSCLPPLASLTQTSRPDPSDRTSRASISTWSEIASPPSGDLAP
jgi:hypothetical protein